MSKYIRAIKVAKDFISIPYTTLDDQCYNDFNHSHVCFVRRLLGSGWKEVCPCYNAVMRDGGPEWSNCCDGCKYFGDINFERDIVGNKQISFYMNDRIVETFGNGGGELDEREN